ncbi:MAG: NAD-dependent epimerase/dehydratase family protein, partial [Planctomycetaceae bacterium]
MTPEQSVYVAGHNGMVGSAVVRLLQQRGCNRIITRSRRELDLTDQLAVQQFFQSQRPDVVVFAAAKVGGILANNSYPAEFLYQNLAMA